MADDVKKVTLGDLLEKKEDYEIHTFGKWEQELKELIDIANKGDAAAMHVLLNVAIGANVAIEKLVDEGKPPIRYFSAIAPVWPLNYPGYPQLKPKLPKNLGKYSDGPLDTERVFYKDAPS